MYVPEEDVETTDEETYEETYEEDEENYEEGAEDDGESDAEGADADEPVDLADALGRVREMDGSDSSETMGGDEAGDDDEGDGSSDNSEEVSEYEEGYDESGDDGDDGAGRGPAMQPRLPTYQAVARRIVRSVNDNSMQMARRKFEEDGIRQFSMKDIAERRDGRIIYHNSDDPNRPFENRMQAQEWIDSMNKQINDELLSTAREINGRALKAVSPTVRMLQFAPTYDAMDRQTQDIFDDLIEEFEVKNQRGEVIGYQCNLDAMARRAAKLAQRYGTKQPSGSRKGSGRPKKQKVPATDMRSHGTVAGSGGKEEPKTIEDAMRLLHEMERKGRK